MFCFDFDIIRTAFLPYLGPGHGVVVDGGWLVVGIGWFVRSSVATLARVVGCALLICHCAHDNAVSYRDRFVKFCSEKVIESLDGHVEVQSQATDSQMLLDTKGRAFPTKLHNFTSIINERFDNVVHGTTAAPSLGSMGKVGAGGGGGATSFDSHSVLLDASRAPIRPARKDKKEKRLSAVEDLFSMTLSPAVFTLLVKNADFRDAKIIITKVRCL